MRHDAAGQNLGLLIEKVLQIFPTDRMKQARAELRDQMRLDDLL
jgi:hypothetical protein